MRVPLLDLSIPLSQLGVVTLDRGLLPPLLFLCNGIQLSLGFIALRLYFPQVPFQSRISDVPNFWFCPREGLNKSRDLC